MAFFGRGWTPINEGPRFCQTAAKGWACIDTNLNVPIYNNSYIHFPLQSTLSFLCRFTFLEVKFFVWDLYSLLCGCFPIVRNPTFLLFCSLFEPLRLLCTLNSQCMPPKQRRRDPPHRQFKRIAPIDLLNALWSAFFATTRKQILKIGSVREVGQSLEKIRYRKVSVPAAAPTCATHARPTFGTNARLRRLFLINNYFKLHR